MTWLQEDDPCEVIAYSHCDRGVKNATANSQRIPYELTLFFSNCCKNLEKGVINKGEEFVIGCREQSVVFLRS